jgi:hypothetical protein
MGTFFEEGTMTQQVWMEEAVLTVASKKLGNRS